MNAASFAQSDVPVELVNQMEAVIQKSLIYVQKGKSKEINFISQAWESTIGESRSLIFDRFLCFMSTIPNDFKKTRDNFIKTIQVSISILSSVLKVRIVHLIV